MQAALPLILLAASASSADPGSPASTPEPARPERRLVAYYAAWSVYARSYRPADIPSERLSHLIYAFATVNERGACASGDAQADAINLPALRALKSQRSALKTLISIGGAGQSGNFSGATRTADARRRLAESCVAFMRQHGFDGIDVDWEFPAGAQEQQHFAELLAELRRQIDDQAARDHTRYLLTIAAPAALDRHAEFDPARLHPLLDWVNLMAYDFAGPWSETTGFNAPLYTPDTAGRVTSVDAAARAYLAGGLPPEKLVLGVSFWGVGWRGVPERDHGLFQRHAGAADGTQAGALAYAEIAPRVAGATRYWHDEAQVPWLYDAQTGTLISYDDAQSLASKAEYVKTHNLGGIMIWELSADDAAHTLLAALHHALRQ